MAGPFQPSDIVTFGRLAWEIYQFGWADELNATKQYTDFGKDVRGLAESLDLLLRVVSEASSSLRREGVTNAVVRWDRVSLCQIVGDYEATLHECYDLICANNRYRGGSTALRNIEWNVLLQPSVERLRQRIVLHNSKILHVLKPFEIDLLCRIRQDVEYMHRDLAYRINAVHMDLHHLAGILVPDLDQALNQQVQRQVHLLEIPTDISDRLRLAALADRPECANSECFGLQDLSDAFILSYDKSTVRFTAGLLVTDRIPTLEQYLNLLKCVWIFTKIAASPALSDLGHESHWPSYIRQLEDDLSHQCSRFGRELVPPGLDVALLTPNMFSIWPAKAKPQLVDVVTCDEIMEEVLEIPLQSSAANITSGLKLLRRQGSDGRKFRIIMTGEERTANALPHQQKEVIDIDLASVVIDPQYALPMGNGAVQELILRRDERIARLKFMSLSHTMKFQQCITGFKPWAYYCQYNATVSFVVGGAKEPVMENACIQLWIPKFVAGSIVTSNDLTANNNGVPSQMSSSNQSSSGTTPASYGRGDRNSSVSSSRNDARRGSGHVSPASLTGRYYGTTSVPQQGSRSSSVPLAPGLVPSSSPSMSSFGSPIGSAPGWLGPQRPGYSPALQMPFPSGTGHMQDGINSPAARNGDRSHSLSSVASHKTSGDDSSSNSEGRSVTISTGTYTTGLLHRRPPKPMLVIFTENQNEKQGGYRRSIVTIQIDEETAINPERCNCRRAGKDGWQCLIAAVEQRGGNADLNARRYETSTRGGESWNMAPLAWDCREPFSTASAWPNLKRVSISFPHPEARNYFGGTPSQCQCKIRTEGDLTGCMTQGHRGLFGEVCEFYRKRRNDYHRARFEGQQQVVNGLMS